MMLTTTQILNVGLEWAGFPALAFYMHSVLKQLQVFLLVLQNVRKYKNSCSFRSVNTGWLLLLVDTDRSSFFPCLLSCKSANVVHVTTSLQMSSGPFFVF